MGIIVVAHVSFGRLAFVGICAVPGGDLLRFGRLAHRVEAVGEGAADASKGGTYGTVRAANSGGEVHHIPMKSALREAGHPMGAGSQAPGGPAIHMDKADHRALPSSRGQGGALSADQAASITPGPGGLDEAFLKGVDEVQAVHGSKYDDAILQAMDELP